MPWQAALIGQARAGNQPSEKAPKRKNPRSGGKWSEGLLRAFVTLGSEVANQALGQQGGNPEDWPYVRLRELVYTWKPVASMNEAVSLAIKRAKVRLNAACAQKIRQARIKSAPRRMIIAAR